MLSANVNVTLNVDVYSLVSTIVRSQQLSVLSKGVYIQKHPSHPIQIYSTVPYMYTGPLRFHFDIYLTLNSNQASRLNQVSHSHNIL